jgi:drug/metabolite transporter (DMT)-like permease
LSGDQQSARSTFGVEAGLVLMVVIWGLNFAVVKWALDSFEPLGFNALRHLIASAFLFAVLHARDGIGTPARADVRRIVVMGVIGNIAYQMAFIYGIDRTRAGNASLMLALVPIFLLLFDRGSSVSRAAWLGAFLSICGVALVSGSALNVEGISTLLGDLILIGAAAVWAIYTMGASPLIARYGPLRATAWTLWVGSFGLALIGLPSLLRQDWALVTPLGWAGVLFSSILSIGVAYLLWYRGVQRLGGPKTAIYANLTPVVALLAGTVWLGERINSASLIGSLLVIGGVLLVRRQRLVSREPDHSAVVRIGSA